MSIVELDRPTRPDLDTLVAVFFARADELGEFRTVSSDDTPMPYRGLLSHDHHMTVTIESFHDSPVDVQVLSVRRSDNKYCRRILLRRQADQAVVQFGIVRLNLELLEPAVRGQIEAAEAPLGRVLIRQGVLREVKLRQLYEVECGPELARLFGVPERTKTYGRTALIYCDGDPAVELLEIVTPASQETDSHEEGIS